MALNNDNYLAVLRTAKAACDEGLIGQGDYDLVKQAFVRAQQIKAGMDVGFLREEDFKRARDSFLHALDFSLIGSPTQPNYPLSSHPSETAAPSGRASPQQPRPPPQAPVVPALEVQSSGNGLARPRSTVDVSASSTPRAVDAQISPSAFAVPQQPMAPPHASVRNSQTFQGGTGGVIPIPAELPRNRGPSLVGKKSMAGIGLSDTCVQLFCHMKAKSAYKWITFKVNDEGTEVVNDQAGAPDASFDSFTSVLPENEPRYGVFDFAYSNADTQQTINKLVFIHWSPATASTRSKMKYSTTKDFVKGFLDGIGADMQAESMEELNMAEIHERVHAGMTRK